MKKRANTKANQKIHRGSDFYAFLEEEGILKEVTATASGRALELTRESVEGTEDANSETAWDLEIRARLARHVSGETQNIPAADVFRRLREIAP